MPINFNLTPFATVSDNLQSVSPPAPASRVVGVVEQSSGSFWERICGRAPLGAFRCS